MLSKAEEERIIAYARSLAPYSQIPATAIEAHYLAMARNSGFAWFERALEPELPDYLRWLEIFSIPSIDLEAEAIDLQAPSTWMRYAPCLPEERAACRRHDPEYSYCDECAEYLELPTPYAFLAGPPLPTKRRARR
jgi:hypothetical protein